jgi:hypothetical protein
MTMTKLSLVGLALAGCASQAHPQATTTTTNLQMEANITLGAMRAHNPGIDPVLRESMAYAVFPDSGKQGVLFEYGKPTGYVALANPAGESYSELLVLRDERDIAALKEGHLSLKAHANATVFVMPRGRSAVQLSSRDQRIDYLGT